MLLSSTLAYGIVLSILASLIIVGTLYRNPRLLLQRYPKDVQQMVPAKTKSEKKQTKLIGILFLLVLIGVPLVSTLSLKKNLDNLNYITAFFNAFGILTIFNLVDLIVIDWLLFIRIRPRFLIIPGSEGAKGYRDFGFHVKGFGTGTVLAVFASALIAMVSFI